jgi:hypothetical protein
MAAMSFYPSTYDPADLRIKCQDVTDNASVPLADRYTTTGTKMHLMSMMRRAFPQPSRYILLSSHMV